ncbi:glycosyltransferase family 39 protein [Pedobacter sp. R20-19]|uniref:ArnT family glycosyltransferase n=1 Tax=Pedobacter sp. R20-19 TaxID=1270196 RepID=UPI00049318A5|nr:glycosyltransferase family 39 protein [Pedobacter sp. R20-19]
MDILSRNYFNVSNLKKLDETNNIAFVKPTNCDYKLDRSIWLLLAFFGLLKFSIHLSGISNYGLHADELYYISLSEKFAWGFLDISPFVTWIAKASSALFGSSIIAWRIIPCMFASATVMLTGLMAHYLGGKKLGITIACSAIICSPAFLATSYLLQPVVFDEFFWALLAFSILRYQQTQKTMFLYFTALTLGFGMLNKYTIGMYLVAILLGCIMVYAKNLKMNWRILPGPLLLFILIMMPNLVWQWAYDFPIFGYLTLVGTKALSFDVLDYIFQLFFFHGAGVAVWTAGFLFLLMKKNESKFNLVWPITLVILVILLAFLKGKLYYGLGMFPVLFAAGGCCWEMILSAKKQAKFIFVATIYLFGLLCLPLVIPILPISICRQYIKKMVSYTAFSRPLVWEDGTSGTIPQFFADMSGWESLSGDINKVSGKEQNRKPIAVLTNSYAIAGALKYYSKLLAPQVISANNSFMLESPNNLPSGTILYLSRDAKEMVAKMARHVSLYKQLKLENSHLKGVNIYILSDVNEVFRKKYTQDRRQFFHSEELINPNKTSTLLSNLIGFKNR